MSRPLRIEFPGALYHVTSRGDRREDIFVDDTDRARLLAVVAQGLTRFDAQLLAYCLMGNHYHFVVHTRQGNLSAVMRHINGVYTQAFNRRHGKVGHLFQGRFKAILVDRDAYLLAVCRYVELNPVRAHMVAAPGDWPWSSYRAHVGQAAPPAWLDSAGLHGYLLGHDVASIADRVQAQREYVELVAAGTGVDLWDGALNRQIYLGDDDFVVRMLDAAAPPAKLSRLVPKAQRSSPKTLTQWLTQCPNRDEAMLRAYTESGLTMTALAAELGVCAAEGVDSENRPQRGQFLPDLQPHSLAIGQKFGKKWTAAAGLQRVPSAAQTPRFDGCLSWPVDCAGGTITAGELKMRRGLYLRPDRGFSEHVDSNPYPYIQGG